MVKIPTFSSKRGDVTKSVLTNVQTLLLSARSLENFVRFKEIQACAHRVALDSQQHEMSTVRTAKFTWFLFLR